MEQPLLSAQVNQNILFIGSVNGYYNIDLDKVSDTTPRVHQIKLKELFVNNKNSALGPVMQKENIELKHNENTIMLKFSTNAHPFPHKLNYQYRLNAGENWSPPTYQPEIFLASLPPKDYDIEVRVTDESTGLSYSQPLLS